MMTGMIVNVGGGGMHCSVPVAQVTGSWTGVEELAPRSGV